MGVVFGLVGLLVLVIWVITIVHIARRHLGAKRTIAWLLLVLILPFIGSVIYWVLEKPTPEEAAEEARVDQELRFGAPPGTGSPPLR
jgi:hypothetical protein